MPWNYLQNSLQLFLISSVQQVDPRGGADAAEEVRPDEAGEGAQPGRALQTVASLKSVTVPSNCLLLYIVIGCLPVSGVIVVYY